MMRSNYLVCLFALLFTWAQPAAAALFSERTTDLQQQAAIATKTGKKLAVLFEQDDCAECLRLKKTVFAEKAASARFGAGYHSVSVNLSRTEALTTPDGRQTTALEWAGRLRIPGTPAIAFFTSDGAILYRHVGPLRSGQELLDLGHYVATAEFDRRPFDAYLATRKLVPQQNVAVHDDICRTRN